MKTNIATLLATAALLCQLLSAAGQPIAATVIAPSGFRPPASVVSSNQNDLTMNFANAPLDQVLAYLSDAAGFIIVQQAPVSGSVTIQGSHLTKDEAVKLLNSELNRNNYAAVRNDRMLTIMTKRDAKTSSIPVLIGNDPAKIPTTDEMATWIVPIRFVEARQLVSDLSLFVSSQATIMANDAGNSIVITDTQANIRHLVEIIQAVDGSAEAETEIRVFPLKYASPMDVANELSGVFPGSNGSGSQSPLTFGGGPGGGPMGFMGMGGSGTSGSEQRIQKAQQVTAVADSRVQAVIVTAPKDLMSQVASTVTSLDVPSDRDQKVETVELQNGDPLQVAQVLQSMFSSGNTSSSGASSQSSALQTRAQNAASTMSQTSTSSSIGGSSSSGGTGSGGGGRTGSALN